MEIIMYKLDIRRLVKFSTNYRYFCYRITLQNRSCAQLVKLLYLSLYHIFFKINVTERNRFIHYIGVCNKQVIIYEHVEQLIDNSVLAQFFNPIFESSI